MLSLSFLALTIVGIAMIGLGTFTLLNNSKKTTNIIFALICYSLSAWMLANFVVDADPTRSLLWTRITFFCIVLVCLWGILFANLFPVKTFRGKWFNLTVGISAAAMSVICFLPGFIPGVIEKDGISTVIEGPLYPIFIAYYFIHLVSIVILLFLSYKHSSGADRVRVQYVLAGIALMSICTSATNLVIPLLTGSNISALFGGYFTLLFIGFTAYAIVKHRLFDIRLLVARSVAYLLMTLTLAASYGLIVFGGTALLFPDNNSSTGSLVFYAIVAVVMALTLPPIKKFFEKLTDKIFFRNNYDSQTLYNDFGQILVGEFKLERLMKQTLSKICNELKVVNGQLYIFNEDTIYRIEHFGSIPLKMITVPHLKQLHHRMLVADELEGGKEKALMEEYGYRFALHLRTKEEFVGYLLLGDKLSGDIYSSKDVEVLKVLGQELAVAISNAKAYEEIANFNATLQGKVDDATKRLREANTHLKELDKAKDEFISMASHQLRTPLTTIKGYLSMLSEGDAGKLQKQQQEFIDYSYAGAQRMVNLISDLLNVSRMSAGKFMIEKAPIDLAEVVDQEVFQLQSHAKAKNLQLIYKKPAKPLGLIELDENKTRQVIMNFIDNAIYYTKEGSVTVSLEKVGDNLELRVKDTGIGVPKDAQKKLFSKFFRADNAQTVRPDGTGLGLYLAKRVIEDQGGKIIFETVEGKGSTFGFSMPAKNLVSPQAAKPKEPVSTGL